MTTLIYVNNMGGKSGWYLTTDIKLDWYWFKPVEEKFVINPIYNS